MIRVVVQELEAGEAEDPMSPGIKGARVDVEDELLLWLFEDEEEDEVDEAVDPDELLLLPGLFIWWLLFPPLVPYEEDEVVVQIMDPGFERNNRRESTPRFDLDVILEGVKN